LLFFLYIQKHDFLDFPMFWQAHLDPQTCLAGTNSDCGGLLTWLGWGKSNEKGHFEHRVTCRSAGDNPFLGLQKLTKAPRTIFTCVASQYLILCDTATATATTTPTPTPRFLKFYLE
jgi:hypothetical protein